MFRKPLDDLKTSAPLRNSDRKKLRQRVLADFKINNESSELHEDGLSVGEDLVPEGLQSVKFITHSGEAGVAYLSSDGEPLWFSVGKGNTDLIPTVYTLWKSPTLLPALSTPSAVIPVLTGGADLMIPGVVQLLQRPSHDASVKCAPLKQNELVAVTQYVRGARGPPLAVGRMTVDEGTLRDSGAKGKAVKILHMYKDCLWEMGGRSEPPEPISVTATDAKADDWPDGERESTGDSGVPEAESVDSNSKEAMPLPASEADDAPGESGSNEATLNPQEVSALLRTSLIQAIRTSLSSLPAPTFPLPSSTLYSAYILPARSAYNSGSPNTPIDIKHSSYKNLTAFLKAADKDGLLAVKDAKGPGKAKGDVVITSVSKDHPDVISHTSYKTVGEVDAKRTKKEQAEELEKQKLNKAREVRVTELWKPHQTSLRLFEVCGKDSGALYTLAEVKATLNAYIMEKALVNPHQQQYINVGQDEVLANILTSKAAPEAPEFLKRDELTRVVLDKMQPWHRIEAEGLGKDAVLKKGALSPISVTIKLRQGRKACTLVTHFEAYGVNADALAEALRKRCASATSVTASPGSAKSGTKEPAQEVMVQGKKIKEVVQELEERGVQKKWIECADLTEKKK